MDWDLPEKQGSCLFLQTPEQGAWTPKAEGTLNMLMSKLIWFDDFTLLSWYILPILFFFLQNSKLYFLLLQIDAGSTAGWGCPSTFLFFYSF